MKYLSLGLILAFLSCGKFEHEELDINVSCELCDWADNREGLYSGEITYDLETGSQDSTWTDSMYVEVEHIFLNNNQYQDSTVMYFRLYAYRDSITNPSPSKRLVIASDSLSLFWGSYYHVNFYEDSMALFHSEGTSWPSWAVYSEIGVLHR